MIKPAYFLYLLIVVCFSSCYEILEEITVNENGGGTMRLMLNCSESRAKISSAMMMNNVADTEVPDRSAINALFARVGHSLRKVRGIDAVSYNVDFDKYIAGLRFEFKEVAAINDAMKALAGVYKITGYNLPEYRYSKNAGIFEKSYVYDAASRKFYNNLKQSRKEMIEGGRFVSVCRFPYSIKSSSNPSYRLLKTQKGLIQRFAVKDFVNGSTNVSSKIQLSK